MRKEETLEVKYITTQIADLIKAKLIEKDLVKTGNLLRSIKVIATPDGFSIKALDYFNILNAEYHITDEVFASKAFVELMAKQAEKQIESEIREELKDIQ